MVAGYVIALSMAADCDSDTLDLSQGSYLTWYPPRQRFLGFGAGMSRGHVRSPTFFQVNKKLVITALITHTQLKLELSSQPASPMASTTRGSGTPAYRVPTAVVSRHFI